LLFGSERMEGDDGKHAFCKVDKKAERRDGVK
jgi:hypothetical protein